MAAHRQQQDYNKSTRFQQFAPGDLVWLSVPTASKLAPHWEGEWKIAEVKNDVNVKISKGMQSKVVHVNRLRHRFQPLSTEAKSSDSVVSFSVEHSITHDEIDPPPITQRYPERNRYPPDRLTY